MALFMYLTTWRSSISTDEAEAPRGNSNKERLSRRIGKASFYVVPSQRGGSGVTAK